MSFDPEKLAGAARQIVTASHFLHKNGWCPATSGNFSMRLDARYVAITASGWAKGELIEDAVIAVNISGQPLLHYRRPSAETPLHVQLYQTAPHLQAVIHTHSLASTVLTRHLRDRDALVLEDYELLKAFPGILTHESSRVLPILDNNPDMTQLAAQVEAWVRDHPDIIGYLIRGHGLYTWGTSMPEALKHVEALEFLLSCELELARLKS